VKRPMTDVVMDTSAILADIHGERGGELVREAMRTAAISAVNFADIITHLIDLGLPAHEARHLTERLGLEVIAADQSTATTAGLLQEKTRRTGVSLEDRFCLALALELRLPVMTADRRWAELDIGVDVRLIR
jgi:ribonuclease VapC